MSTAEPKRPRDIEEIYNGIKVELELKLSEAETLVLATNAQSTEVVQKAILETTTLVGEFVEKKSKMLEKSWNSGKASTARLRRIMQEISTLQTKLANIDKGKELSDYKKQMSSELDQEVPKE
jgi:hypothetical protein